MDTAHLNGFLAVLGRLSAEAAILVVLVVAAQWAFRKHLSPRWRCALWLLLAARLLMPFSFGSITSVFNLLPDWSRPHASAPAPTPETASFSGPVIPVVKTPPPLRNAPPPTPIPPPAVQTTQPRTPSWPLWIFAAWLAGAVLLAGQVLVSSVRLWKRSVKLQPLTNSAALAALDDCCAQLKVRNRPVPLESVEIKSPALHGLFRPRLLLPKGFIDQFSLAELRFVFLHELAHLKRRDLLANWVMAALQIIHWFNPLVWFGFARWRADREIACDAMALEVAGQEQNELYGQTILRLLENFSRPVSTPGLVGILEDKRQLRRRIFMIANYAPATKWPVLALLLATGLAAIGLTDARDQSSNNSPSIGEVTMASGRQPQFEIIDTQTVADNAPTGVTTGSNLTILVTNHGPWLGVVQYHTAGVQRQAEGAAQSFSNLFQLRRILGVKPEAFRFIDCWNAVAKTMPTGITLERMIFTDRTKLGLSGTAPADQVPKISDFYDKLRKSEKDGQPLFEANTDGTPTTQSEPGSSLARWSFDVNLKGASKTSKRSDGFNLTILSTNYPGPGSQWAAGYHVMLNPTAINPSPVTSENLDPQESALAASEGNSGGNVTSPDINNSGTVTMGVRLAQWDKDWAKDFPGISSFTKGLLKMTRNGTIFISPDGTNWTVLDSTIPNPSSPPAAFDCWDAVAETLPAGFTLDRINLTGGTKLHLSGTAPADQVPTIGHFYDKLRKSERNGQPLFEANTLEAPTLSPKPGSLVSWSFELDLNGAFKTSENLDSYGLTVLATNYPSDPSAAAYHVMLNSTATSPSPVTSSSPEPQQNAPTATASSDIANELIGAWEIISTPSGSTPTPGGPIQFYTGKYWCITQCDPNNGVVTFHQGGTYTINGNECTETVQYANPSTMSEIGRTNLQYNIKIEGDTMTVIDIYDPSRKEVWKKRSGGPGSNSKMSREMTGTWVLVGEPGNVGKPPASGAGYKFITPTDWCDTQADAKTGVVVIHHGGTCTFNGSEYVESVKYGNPPSLRLIGHDSKFNAKVDGDTLTIKGIANPWNEVWKRVK